MLHHEDTPEEISGIAALRVSPDELTRAIASLDAQKREEEKRREAEERHLAETVELGQAVDSLDLEYTPEELWAEVQYQRTISANSLPEQTEISFGPVPTRQREVAGQKTAGTRMPMNWRPIQLAAGAACLSALLTAAGLLHSKSPIMGISWSNPFLSSTARHNIGGIMGFVRPVGTLDEDFYRMLAGSRGPAPRYRIRIVSWKSPKMSQTVYPLQAVPDGYPMFDDQYLNSGVNTSPYGVGFVFSDNQEGVTPHQKEWMRTRYDGRYYLRGWIKTSDVPRLAQKKEVFIYASCNLPGAASQPITLAEGNYPTDCYSGPLTNATQSCYETLGNNEVLKIPQGSKVILDKHAWENFPTMTPPEYQPQSWAKLPNVFVGDSDFASPGFDASSNVQPLSAIPDKTIVHCSDFTINQMLHALPNKGFISQTQVDVRPNLYRPWRIIKLDGTFYIRGWISAKITQQQASNRSIAIYSEPDTSEFINPPVQFSLRFDQVNWVGTSRNGFSFNHDGPVGGVINGAGSGISRLEVANVHLDQHAWDKW